MKRITGFCDIVGCKTQTDYECALCGCDVCDLHVGKLDVSGGKLEVAATLMRNKRLNQVTGNMEVAVNFEKPTFLPGAPVFCERCRSVCESKEAQFIYVSMLRELVVSLQALKFERAQHPPDSVKVRPASADLADILQGANGAGGS